MSWGQIEPKTKIRDRVPSGGVYFAGSTQYTLLGLCGSVEQVLGVKKKAINNIDFRDTFGPSTLSGFIRILRELYESDQLPNDNSEDMILRLIVHATISIEEPEQHLEFLAKTLIHGISSSDKHVVLGTPIYVALAD